MVKPKALYILGEENYERVYGVSDRDKIAELVELIAPPQTPESVKKNPELLHDIEIILSSWGAPNIDAEFLEHARKLEIVFYGAGSIKGIVSDAFWDRGVKICGAWGANGITVAEYTLSQILWGLKLGHRYARQTTAPERWGHHLPVFGAYGSTVGIISLGAIGSRVCELLRNFELEVIAYDPYVSAERARELNVELVELAEIFSRSAVVSLHTPNLPETQNMLKGRHFASMRENATFIDTGRGAVIDEPAMIEVLQKRPDITAVLDVTDPEPPAPDSPLWTLENVVLTPHIAGAVGLECQRMGRFMREELERYLNGEALAWQITREKAKIMA